MKSPFSHIFDLQSDGAFIVKVPLIRVYIPGAFVEHKISEIMGQEIDTIALFHFDTFGENADTFDEENPYKKPIRYFMKIPTVVRMCPSDILEERDDDKNIVYVLEFVSGDIFLKNVNVVQDWKTVNKVIELLIKGFIPKELGYNEIVKFISDSCYINDTKLEVSDVIYEILVAELSRNPENINEAFRYLVNKKEGKIDMTAKQMISIDRLGRINNTFAAITSQDPRLGISTSVIRHKTGQKEKESSIEKVLTDV